MPVDALPSPPPSDSSPGLTRRTALAAGAALALPACGVRSDEHTLRFWAMGREGEVAHELLAGFRAEHPELELRIEQLPWTRLAAAAPKVFAGLSDITTLHQALASGLGVATLWSPMPATRALAGCDCTDADAWSRQGLLDALLAQPSRPRAVLAGETMTGAGSVEAPLVGGTVSLLAAMAGTPGAIPAAGAIAVLEDVNEHPYRIERFLTQLRRSGFFDGVLAVACGDFVDCGPAAQLRTVLEDRLGYLGVPVVAGLPFGHGPHQGSLWLGRPATLDADRGTLTQPRPA